MRNKRRTAITASSIFFAAFLSIIMRSFQLGSYGNMVFNMVETYSGFLQVQNEDYFEEPSIDNLVAYSEETINKIYSADENVKIVIPRLQYFSLISYDKRTKGVAVSGILPDKENEVSKLSTNLVRYRFTTKNLDKFKGLSEISEDIKAKFSALKKESFTKIENIQRDLVFDDDDFAKLKPHINKIFTYTGEYLEEKAQRVLVSDRLSKFMGINTGDTIVLFGQGYHGVSSAGKYAVSGVVKMPNPELDKRMVYMPLSQAQEYFSAYAESEDGTTETPLITSYVINLNDNSDETVALVQEKIKKTLLAGEVVKNWKELNKKLVQQIDSDNVSGQMMVGILYMIIMFGILGTVLMMVAERKREMGIMTAIGMKKFQHGIVVTLEMIFISLFGTFAGMVASAPIIVFGYYNPIRLTGEEAKIVESYGTEAVIPMSWFDSYFYNQTFIILAIVAVVMIYPIITILKMKLSDALRA